MRRRLLDKALTALLVLAVVAGGGALAYQVARPGIQEKFTQFYILGPQGKAGDYPRELPLGQEAGIILGIVNQEGEAVEYRVEVTIAGERVGEVGPIDLAPKEKWEGEVAFTPGRAGPAQKVEFLLYKGGAAAPYLSLYLWIDVLEKGT